MNNLFADELEAKTSYIQPSIILPIQQVGQFLGGITSQMIYHRGGEPE